MFDKCTIKGTILIMSTQPILFVKFFMTQSGNEPVLEWLRNMERENKKIIGEDIKLIQFRWP